MTWIVGKASAPLVKATKLVDYVIEIAEKDLLEGNFSRKAVTILSVWRELFGRSYDLIITAHADPRYRLLSAVCYGKKRRMLNRFFSRRHPVPGRFHAYEYLRLFATRDLHWPKLELPQSALPEKSIALFPGGEVDPNDGRSLRRWDVQNYVTLAEKFLEREIPVLLIGGPQDAPLKEAFSHLHVIDQIGNTSLLETLSLLKECSLLIAHDSGPLHLAKLVGCKSIGLFGPTNPREFSGPEDIFIWKGDSLPCSPCYDGKTFAPCKNPICMKSISVEEVLEGACKLIRE